MTIQGSIFIFLLAVFLFIIFVAGYHLNDFGNKIHSRHIECIADIEKNGSVKLLGTAPDGTNLWKLETCDDSDRIYWSGNKVTECHEERHSKITSTYCNGVKQ
jgi:hypothetical protein